MKYFVSQSSKKENDSISPERIEQELFPQHVAHVQSGVESGMVLMAGPSAQGGILILRAESEEEVRGFLENDPIYRSGLSSFALTEFMPKDRADIVKDW